MGWSAIIGIIVALLPVVLEWVKKLLDKTAARMGWQPSPDMDPAAVGRLFDAAEKELTWLDVLRGRRRRLRAVRRVAMERAPQIVGAAFGSGAVVPPLTEAEVRELGA